ncbi:MAG: class I SAM-dependent methyltransferase [Nitrososphaerota archaeon]|nr:class I SAM-dependent methyltransferase [Nitrososphaerota archaeon]
MNSWREKRSVANRYNITSGSYDEQYAQEQEAKYCAVQKVLNWSGDCGCGGVVLDVGCGSGLFFSCVADKVQSVVGVDISRNLLLKAKVRAKFFCNVHVVQADADFLPFKDSLFDVIFSFTVLQNMPIPKKTLCEFKRHITTGGKLVVTGLKKVFGLTVFLDLFETNELRLLEFIDDSDLKCYIALVAC